MSAPKPKGLWVLRILVVAGALLAFIAGLLLRAAGGKGKPARASAK